LILDGYFFFSAGELFKLSEKEKKAEIVFGLPTAVKAIQIDVYYSESMYSFRIQDAVVHMLKV
jgi:hypothetical protein